jgi:hypothetical protein
MPVPKAARAAPASAVRDPSNVDKLPGNVDIINPTKFRAQVQFLERRFGLALVCVAVIAELAFSSGRRA